MHFVFKMMHFVLKMTNAALKPDVSGPVDLHEVDVVLLSSNLSETSLETKLRWSGRGVRVSKRCPAPRAMRRSPP